MPAPTAIRALLTLVALLPLAAGAQTEYLRIATDAAGMPAALQMPIFTFASTATDQPGLEVDLVGAIHIGDARYYAALNERFAGYDAVLYELVAPEGARPLPDSEPNSLVGFTQVGMTRMLGLTHQLDQIDYLQRNFVHADLTPEALARSMSDRGESVFGYVSRLFTAALRGEVPEPTRPAGAPGFLEMLFSADRERLLKIEFAHSMLDVESMTRVIEGDQGSSVIGERNARAIEVLAERIRLGEQRIAIFYGVAHLPDLEARLASEFGLVQRDVTWLDAWDLRPAPAP